MGGLGAISGPPLAHSRGAPQLRWGVPSVWGVGAISGPPLAHPRGGPRRRWGGRGGGGVGGHFGAPIKIKTALTGADERGRAGVRRSDADPAGAGSASVRLLASVKKQARCRARKCG